MKKIFLVTLLIILLMLSILPVTATANDTALDANIIRNLFQDSFYPPDPTLSFLYDTDQYQAPFPHVSFDCDSKGQSYAYEKKYVYMDWSGKNVDFSDIHDRWLTLFKKYMTPELATRMVENFHVSGGPDVEFVRQDADGNWYKLFLISPVCPVMTEIINISVNGNHATAIIDSKEYFYVIDDYDGNYARITYPIISEQLTVELDYTTDGWKLSGGTWFDYLRNYAETSPYTGDESDDAVITLAAGATVSALIPTAVFIRRRKRRFEA